ncbi:hypothetical protein LUCX_132 [Xanthomonas phage vB_XciM_LucasX]|nr:hypothetical protein LUCX_132 [Xanthomonas phage vB_XciM_LucasX]
MPSPPETDKADTETKRFLCLLAWIYANAGLAVIAHWLGFIVLRGFFTLASVGCFIAFAFMLEYLDGQMSKELPPEE